ncbi:myeloid leukemia factor 1 isoform X2 [Pelodiscus sinensis]|uniref:Myeloid leukemia factor 1 n=1 Tax=Pelodiscus sinensis TaxID=13735 RepID=K7G6L8_PELSI|nr:myeloid leukemia factor 1 isoform X3 [Pelodiscus sinensis]XP_025040639.1 myeloid leukemia factor 1 isoform X4 [Pelodiscus sinensis]|eukprot:XP_006123517.1 myeloid leukemia factor 1 isoform X3 [Pelodiscus sinensis]
MFGNRGLRELFEEDPFFREPFAAQHQFMHQMMRSFSDPFGRDPFLSITEGGERTQDTMIPRGHHDSQIALRGNHRNSDFRDPFFAIDRTISNMRNSMLELRRNFDQLSLSPDAHSFSSSSVMTYSKTGDEPPKVFQASAQTHTAPGGIKETRKALKDSESGLEKMAIGHHIHDRAHVIKKSKNNKTGDQELNQEFINLDEAEAHIFDEEWQKEIMKFGTSRAKYNLEAVKHRNNRHISKEDALRREKPHSKPLMAGSRKPEVSVENLNVKGSHVPVKTSKR